jgi:tripartite-type tricarboxylate transporter receptor subunit TctC
MVHVPNKGMSPALLDVISGNVQLMFASVPGMMHEKTRVRPVAMAELKRSALLPELPTMDEQGLKGFAVANWAGLLGPARLDPAIVRKLHDEVIAILALDDIKDRIKTLGFDVIASTPADFGAQMRQDVTRWGAVVEKAGIQKN